MVQAEINNTKSLVARCMDVKRISNSNASDRRSFEAVSFNLAVFFLRRIDLSALDGTAQ
jgi:hypothetical protein